MLETFLPNNLQQHHFVSSFLQRTEEIVAESVLLVFGIFRRVPNLVNAGWPIARLRGCFVSLSLRPASPQYGAAAVKPKREAASKSPTDLFPVQKRRGSDRLRWRNCSMRYIFAFEIYFTWKVFSCKR